MHSKGVLFCSHSEKILGRHAREYDPGPNIIPKQEQGKRASS